MNNWYKQHAPLPELDFSLPIVIVRRKITLLLVPPTINEPNYQWLNINTGRLNSETGWTTPQKAINSYSDGDLAFNIDLDTLIRQI